MLRCTGGGCNGSQAGAPTASAACLPRDRCTSDCMSFPEEATHPRYYGEGYPDWPGRASNKEGESWTSIAGLSSESIRQSCAMRLRSRRMVVAGEVSVFAGEAPTKEARAS